MYAIESYKGLYSNSFLNTPLCSPQIKECLPFFFCMRIRVWILFCSYFINPEHQYATNSLILKSYLKGEEVQNKNAEGWHGSLLWLQCCHQEKASVFLATLVTFAPGKGSFWGYRLPPPQRLPALLTALALLMIDWEAAWTPACKGRWFLPEDTQ